MSTERAILAGGCFWGMQDLIRKQPGRHLHPRRLLRRRRPERHLPQPRHPRRGDRDRLRSRRASPSAMLLEFFFQIHDPTTQNRQGNDVGRSYRSAIFYTSDEQKQRRRGHHRRRRRLGPVARARSSPRSTPAGAFWEAEPEHQDYLQNATPTATPATSPAPAGSSRSAPRPDLRRADLRSARRPGAEVVAWTRSQPDGCRLSPRPAPSATRHSIGCTDCWRAWVAGGAPGCDGLPGSRPGLALTDVLLPQRGPNSPGETRPVDDLADVAPVQSSWRRMRSPFAITRMRQTPTGLQGPISRGLSGAPLDTLDR